MATLLADSDLGEIGAVVGGDLSRLAELRAMVNLPDTHRAGAEEILARP